jgi:hypothetical protein
MLESDSEISRKVDGIPLWPTVLGLHHGPSHRGEDGLTPAEAILQSDAEDRVVEEAGAIETHSPGTRACLDEVVGIPLPENVRPVAGNLLARRVRGDPFSPEREINDDWSRRKNSSLFVMPSIPFYLAAAIARILGPVAEDVKRGRRR